MAPSNGQPNDVPSVTVARTPSAFARVTTRSPATTDSSVEAPAFRWLNSSLTANA